MDDRHLVFIANSLEVPLETTSFAKISTFNKFKNFLQKYLPSTAENYTWRVHRFMSKDPYISQSILKKYADLHSYYKVQVA